MIRIPPHIAALTPYAPGKPLATLSRELGITDAIKLASNENPLGASPKALSALRNSLRNIARYPDATAHALIEALATRWKVAPGQIILGNGSNEVIELLVRAFILPDDEAIMAEPTFSLYRLMVTVACGRPVQIPLRGGGHDLAAMAKAVTPRTKFIFVCNPNNPTGTIVRREALRKFVSRLPKRILVILDEAYAEYATDPEFPDALALLNEGASLIRLRTFSKLYGLAALRIGYGIGAPDLVEALNRVRQPFNTNDLAQQAALASLSDDTHVARTLSVNRAGMAMLTRQFDLLGIPFLPSQTNFIYFEMSTPKRAHGVYTQLLHQGVIIRHMGGAHLRVTIGRPTENRRFLRALREVIQQEKKP
jgi:histidinol-phosphate aminotransferase